jgi:hypothetical protein
MIAVCTLGCDRKADEGFPSWPTLFQLEGDYQLYLNYEGHSSKPMDCIQHLQMPQNLLWSLDRWNWGTIDGHTWRTLPKFDQDQARLASIVIARNMCIEYAMQTGASHLLFIDADIVPPLDIIPKLLEVNKLTVGGLVHGRGVHSGATYLFGEKNRTPMLVPNGATQIVECEHSNIGFTMIKRDVFEQVRFRYGIGAYPDGRKHNVSDDPAYHLDTFLKFNEWHHVRMDVLGRHVGDLKDTDVSQY